MLSVRWTNTPKSRTSMAKAKTITMPTVTTLAMLEK